jgi:hypothetical protein
LDLIIYPSGDVSIHEKTLGDEDPMIFLSASFNAPGRYVKCLQSLTRFGEPDTVNDVPLLLYRDDDITSPML